MSLTVAFVTQDPHMYHEGILKTGHVEAPAYIPAKDVPLTVQGEQHTLKVAEALRAKGITNVRFILVSGSEPIHEKRAGFLQRQFTGADVEKAPGLALGKGVVGLMQKHFDSKLGKVVVNEDVWKQIVDGVNADLAKVAEGAPGQTIIVLADEGKIKQDLEVLGFEVENFDSKAEAHIVTLSKDLKGTGQPVVVPAVEVR
jgi:hypothetical protein